MKTQVAKHYHNLKISYRDAIVHDRRKFIGIIKVVDSVLWILLEPLS